MVLAKIRARTSHAPYREALYQAENYIMDVAPALNALAERVDAEVAYGDKWPEYEAAIALEFP